MGVWHLVKYGLTLSPRVAAARALRMARRTGAAYGRQMRDRGRSTYAPIVDPPPVLAGLVPAIDPSMLAPQAETIASVAGRILEHRFDLLGSGWVRVEPGMTCAGFEGRRCPPVGAPPLLSPGNREPAAALRRLIDAGYRPIDWQIDFRSGYRWSEAQASGTLRYGHAPGADVKVPLELGRLQHLPLLAWAYILAGAGTPGLASPDAYRREFRNQVLDFLAANPPRFGVNWAITMDVALRAANLVLALDLFRRHGAQFDDAFLGAFAAALRAHGRHIVEFLEWHDDIRGNHYLADIVGLLFVAAALPADPETDLWLAFAVHQLVAEAGRQFTPDGAGVEASLSYHRLCAEMVVYGTAVVLGLDEDRRRALAGYDAGAWRRTPPLPPPPLAQYPLPGSGGESLFPPSHWPTLEAMAQFSRDATKPNGRVVQIGDTDNARLFKLCPVYGPDGEEEHLDHRSLVAAVNGLFGRADLAEFAGPAAAVESAVVAGLAGGRRIPPTGRPAAPMDAAGAPADDPPWHREVTVRLPDPSVLDGVTAVAYPDFGLYIWRGPRLFVSVRCGPAGPQVAGCHAHNDQLSVELNVDGEDWLADPGTYVYTAALDRRDKYRSVRAHTAPRMGAAEPGRLDLGPFRLGDRAHARCLHFDGREFRGVHRGYGSAVTRSVTVGDGRIVIRDATDGVAAASPERVTFDNGADLRRLFAISVPFSPGYGRQS